MRRLLAAAVSLLSALSLAGAHAAPATPAIPLPVAAGASAPDAWAPGRAVVAEIDHIVTPRGVQETLEVTLGGARQVVSVRGADRDNPILLFIHGGPAAVEMPVAWAFQRPWEDFFTVVQWDQRGAGRSFPLNDRAALAPTLRPERYRDDAIELIEWLRRRYHQRKVFVLGHSWGSIVGLSVAAKRPDLLYAYIGMGQIIDFRENERLGFEWTLRQARDHHDAQAVRELEALRPYPGDGPFALDKIGTERKWSVHYGALAAGRADADFYFHAARLSPEYGPADRQAWDDGSAWTMTTLFPQLADISFRPLRHVGCPVVMLLGREDWTTPSSLTADWMAALDAPRKQVAWFEHSAHLPMIEEPGRVLMTLVRDVRPLAEGALPGRAAEPAASATRP